MLDLCKLIFGAVIDLLRSRATLEAEIVLLRQEINVLRRGNTKRLPFGAIDRLILGGVCRLFPKTYETLAIVRPDTVIRWHRAGFRFYWRWKSRRRCGRPTVPLEIRGLIREVSVANPLWGAPRIHGELLKLGIDVGQTSVAKYMVRRRGPPSQGWKTFLRNHADGIAAMDLFVVPTISFRLLYGLLNMSHGRRQILWFGFERIFVLKPLDANERRFFSGNKQDRRQAVAGAPVERDVSLPQRREYVAQELVHEGLRQEDYSSKLIRLRLLSPVNPKTDARKCDRVAIDPLLRSRGIQIRCDPKGDANGGHSYGTELSEPDKRALIGRRIHCQAGPARRDNPVDISEQAARTDEEDVRKALMASLGASRSAGRRSRRKSGPHRVSRFSSHPTLPALRARNTSSTAPFWYWVYLLGCCPCREHML
jgi:hypothetical protein